MTRTSFPMMLALLFFQAVSTQASSTERASTVFDRIYRPGELQSDTPASRPQGVRSDTVWFGDYDYLSGLYYARAATNDKEAVKWTFDRGNGPPAPGAPLIVDDPLSGDAIVNGEGWFARDLTENTATYWHVIDATLDLGDYPPSMGGGAVDPPILLGAASLWIGADASQAASLCWECGAGYGNEWCQRVASPQVAYDGVGTVRLTLTYFNDSESCYDGTRIYLKRTDGTELLMNPSSGDCDPSTGWDGDRGGFTGRIGVDSLVPPGSPWLVAPVTWTSRDFTSADIPGGAQELRIVIEFTSDMRTSDEDCRLDFIWGPFATDNVTIDGSGVSSALYTFETGLEGWTPDVCAGIGDFAGVIDLDPLAHVILDPCHCKLSDNVLEAAEYDPISGEYSHLEGQHVNLSGPICDLAPAAAMFGSMEILLDFDMYGDMPTEDATFIRPRWRYYPYVCEATGSTTWSPVIGDYAYHLTGGPLCSSYRYSAHAMTGPTVPHDAQMVIPILELYSSCEAFTIDDCSHATNLSPIFDNIAVGVTRFIDAPAVSFENGTEFQDVGSFPSDLFDPRAPGPANIVLDKNFTADPTRRNRCGDSLIVAGPIALSDPNGFYDVQMWWRVAKKAPFQPDTEGGVPTAYKVWRDRVADGLAIDRPYRPEFTFGIMDSVQIGTYSMTNRLLSRFSEQDDDFAGESSASDMLPDNVFRPGTKIEYFFTSNYLRSPTVRYYFPDTLGGNFFEFEVLPGLRFANVPGCAQAGVDYCAYQPATLYIDVYNRGAQFFVENALRTILNGYPPCSAEEGCSIPADRNWDRYDYGYAASHVSAPFARGTIAGSNNGMTLSQILGYRAILVNTGDFGAGTTKERDWELFDEWLRTSDCGANINGQFFAMNGDKCGEILEERVVHGLPFLTSVLGAALFCDSFNGVSGSDPACGPEEDAYCVRLTGAGGAPPYFPPQPDVDAYGNWCPNLHGFNVYSPETGSGAVGNRGYQAEEGGKSMSFEQVIRHNSDAGANYKTIIDGVSWNHMTRRNPLGSGEDLCPRSNTDIIAAILGELGGAMRWGFNAADYAGIPKLARVMDLSACEGTWTWPAGVGVETASPLVNRLFQNEPNPFSPRTTIRFSLAQSGTVRIVIYDLGGRQVKELVDGPMDPGRYSATWDGTDDSNHRVGSGLYWSQMKVGSYVSNKKMTVLR